MALSSNDSPRADRGSTEKEKAAQSQGPTGSNHAWAAESSDPAVHKLLADRQTAAMNEDDDQVREIDRELDKLAPR